MVPSYIRAPEDQVYFITASCSSTCNQSLRWASCTEQTRQEAVSWDRRQVGKTYKSYNKNQKHSKVKPQYRSPIKSQGLIQNEILIFS